MLTAPLPAALEEALAEQVGAGAGLAAAREELTRRYRSAAAGPASRSRIEVLAYAAARLPATYAAVRIALAEVAERAPWLSPAGQLDLGTGPGTALWAARETWPSIREVTAIEAEPEMRTLARALGGFAAQAGDVPAAIPDGSFDLVTISYLLGELAEPLVWPTVDRAWEATAGVVVVVEPGTPAGYRRVLAARDQLLSRGGQMLAPCPHGLTCPLAGVADDWCHFAVRVTRSRAHRAAKAAALGHEDEKFAYVAIGRQPGRPAGARVLRHPQVHSGHVALELCTPSGLRRETVSRRDGELYRRARKVDWGGDLDT